MKKLIQKDIDKLKAAQQSLDKASTILDNRMAYILKTICNVFKMRYDDSWRVDSDDAYHDYDDAYGKLPVQEVLSKDKDITYFADFYPLNDEEYDTVFIDNKKKEYSLYESIPKRWLFEDFEEELMVGARKYIIKCKKDKELQQAKALKKNVWLVDVKEKLTASEWTKLEKYFKGY
jgi:hypothetical protein